MLSSVSIVPDKWLVTNKCQWPPYASTNLIRRNPSPQWTWEMYQYVGIIKSSGEVFLFAFLICRNDTCIIVLSQLYKRSSPPLPLFFSGWLIADSLAIVF